MIDHKSFKVVCKFLIIDKKPKIFPLSTGLSWDTFPKSKFFFKENMLSVCFEGLEDAKCEMHSVLSRQGANTLCGLC